MLSRRAFLLNSGALAAAPPSLSGAQERPLTVLNLQRRSIEVKGRSTSIYAIRADDGASGVAADIGSRFSVRVKNDLNEPSLIHWRGLTPRWRQDGVPGISGPRSRRAARLTMIFRSAGSRRHDRGLQLQVSPGDLRCAGRQETCSPWIEDESQG